MLWETYSRNFPEPLDSTRVKIAKNPVSQKVVGQFEI